jgi:lysophospholipase L1-like esterase
MKKSFISITLFILIFHLLVHGHTLLAMAQKDEQKVYLWANDLSRKPEDPAYLSLYYRLKKTCFSIEPHAEHPIVFLGDSITDDGDWSNLFPGEPVENRGIGGDTTTGVLNRLDQVIELKPSRIFLMIGTNDLCFNRSVADTVMNYRYILTRLHSELPDTPIYIQSVLPFNDEIFPSRNLRTNNNIKQLNAEILKLAQQYHCSYIDLTADFTDSNGRLFSQYTSDGLHLNEAAYLIWRDQIKQWVKPLP